MSSISSSTGSRTEIADQYAAQQAEKEKLRAEHEAEMDRLNKTYTAEKEANKDRFETTIQSEKAQTYENLRNTKKQFTNTEKTLKQNGDERLHQKADEYRQEELRISKEGKAKVDDATRKAAAVEEYQRAQANAADTMARHNLSHNALEIIRDSDNKIAKLQQEKMATLEKRRAEHGIATNQISEYYNKTQDDLLSQHEKDTLRIKEGVDGQINKSLIANSQRLEEHLSKQDDPFYRMAHIDSEFNDHGEFYQLRVRLPEHERKGFKVQISGQELQFSGMRTSNQKAEVEPGHSIDTNSFQSFSERYKFDTPVDSRNMQATQDDDWLVYNIPKYGANHRMREENIHSKISKNDLEMSREMDFKDTLPVPTAVKTRGSGTLS